MVYNLEIEGEHVYSVAASGLLVHNDCVDWVGENIGDIGGEAVFITPKNGAPYVGMLPGYKYGEAFRGGALSDEAHAFIIKEGQLFDEMHKTGTNAAQWFGDFMDKNGHSSISEMLDWVDFGNLP